MNTFRFFLFLTPLLVGFGLPFVLNLKWNFERRFKIGTILKVVLFVFVLINIIFVLGLMYEGKETKMAAVFVPAALKSQAGDNELTPIQRCLISILLISTLCFFFWALFYFLASLKLESNLCQVICSLVSILIVTTVFYFNDLIASYQTREQLYRYITFPLLINPYIALCNINDIDVFHQPVLYTESEIANFQYRYPPITATLVTYAFLSLVFLGAHFLAAATFKRSPDEASTSPSANTGESS